MEESEEDPELEDHQLDHDDGNAKIGASDNSFDLDKEPGDESNLDYDPSRDHQIDLYYVLTSQIDYVLSLYVYSIASQINEFCAGYYIACIQLDRSF